MSARRGSFWGARALAAGCLVVAMLGMVSPAHAGRACDARPITAEALVRGLQLAHATHGALEAAHARDGTRVVLLARAGQDLSAHGLRYSHAGWAYRLPDGGWRVLHKLNTCGTAEGVLYRQGLGVFFLDDLWRHEAAWVVPAPALQAPLHAALLDGQRAVALHEPAYNMVSYPWSTRYQQSNQWAIELLAAALEPGIARRDQAQAWLRFKGYQPTSLRVGALQRLGARVGTAHIAFDDHPNAQRFADRIDTVTVDSVFQWMTHAGLASPPERLVR